MGLNEDMFLKQVKKAVTTEAVMPEGTIDADVLTAHRLFSAQRNHANGKDESTKGKRKARRWDNKARSRMKSTLLQAGPAAPCFTAGTCGWYCDCVGGTVGN